MTKAQSGLPKTLVEFLDLAKEILKGNSYLVERELLDTEGEAIVRHCYQLSSQTQLTRTDFILNLRKGIEKPVCDLLRAQVERLAKARARGTPLQYLIGTAGFLDHEYEVGPDVLVPRPETEVLVSHVIQYLESLDPSKERMGIEIGIGSGAISVELLARFPNLKITASDLSKEAIQRSEKNAKRILGEKGSGRLRVFHSLEAKEVFEPFERAGQEGVDFIVSNPPYLVENDPIEDDVLHFEPEEALFAPNDDPLYFYRKISSEASNFLVEGGQVFVEIPTQRSREIVQCFEASGWSTQVYPDLNRLERVVIANLVNREVQR